jgi:cyclomaltodextrinase / maltogenic alpha-amylase / neopullulanase
MKTFPISRLRRRAAAWLLLFNGLLLAACSTNKAVNAPGPGAELIFGKATPINLHPDSTRVFIEDYVLDYPSLDSITTSGGLRIERLESQLLLWGNPSEPLAVLTFWKGGLSESVLLKKSVKQAVKITYRGEGKTIQVKGEFNAWNPASTTLLPDGDNYATILLLNPGMYQYLFVIDGKEIKDPDRPAVSNGMSGWNSLIDLPRPDMASLPLLKTIYATRSEVILTAGQVPNGILAFWNNTQMGNEFISVQDKQITIRIPANAQKVDRSTLRIWAWNDAGISNEILIPIAKGQVISDPTKLSRQDKEAMTMYFLMVDRFVNGNPANDKPLKLPTVHPMADYFGGDLAGVTTKINDGYFEWLGTNTLWLSPITQNPEGPYGKYPNPETSFSGYHGYWPVSNVKVDYRFGTSEEFRELVNTAHGKNMNVLLDYVANHVHAEHPIYQKNPDWATPLYLPDGTENTQKWDEHRLTTWFDTFMPTLDLRRKEIVDPMTDSAMFWLLEYQIDGFRHDATKHIDLLFWRELTKKVKKQNAVQPVFQIGETYGSRELINSYINTGMLDAQFDFNNYDAAVAAFAQQEGSLKNLAASLRESMAYYGDHHLMGNITGNQDRARFISYADGSLRFDEDAKYAGWTREINVRDTTAYRKLSALTAFMMTIPGIPCIYYGDEYGSPGGNDPDNRRQMQFDDLNKYEQATRERARKLIQLRKDNMALLYGDLEIVQEDEKLLVLKRSYFNNTVISLFNTSEKSIKFDVGLTGGTANFYAKISGSTVDLPAYSFDILTFKK